MTERIRIGELAAECGVTRDTIRFYERAGLLPKPRRTTTRHRIYDEQSARQVRFIRRGQELGLTLDDIRQLIELRDGGSAGAGQRIIAILRARYEAISQRMEAFEKYRSRLKRAIDEAHERPANLEFLESIIEDDRSVKEA